MVNNTPVKVSVAICVFNEEEYIEECVRSLLRQTYGNFELIIVDDHSTDNTGNIVRSLSDERLRYFRNEEKLGIGKCRNISLALSSGEYIFFTDGDCTARKDWIQQGVETFEEKRCAGIEGTIYYVSEHYQPTFCDHVIKNETGGKFITANMAYRKDIIRLVGGFDEKYTYNSDRNLGLKVLRTGALICYEANMVVYHPRVIMGVKEFVRNANRVKNKVYLFKQFQDRQGISWRIVYPRNLIVILFPPAIVLSLFINRYRKWDDFRLLPFIYVRAIYERFSLWRECIRERVFLI
jgi:glycosyltransferase involved in cell wall biosynthesis